MLLNAIPVMIAFFRPNLSPSVKAAIAPKNAPNYYLLAQYEFD